METFIKIKCYYGNRCVDLSLANSTYELQELIERTMQILDQTGKTFLRSNIVGAIHNNVEIYLQHLLLLKDGDKVVFLLAEPLNDPISPGDESVRARVYEADVANEGATIVNLPEKPPAELIKLKQNTIDIKPQIHEPIMREHNAPFIINNGLFNFVDDTTTTYDVKLQQLLHKSFTHTLPTLHKFFQMPRAEFLWHSQLFLPMLNECSLHGILSGNSKLMLLAEARHSRTRNLFKSGIFPDFCDGWLLKERSVSEPFKDLLLRTPQNRQIYLRNIPRLQELCGDGCFLLLDLFVEVKPGPYANLDRAKLHLMMLQAAREFAERINLYPFVFGLTCDGPLISAYAAKAKEEPPKLRKTKRSLHKQILETTSKAVNDPNTPRASRSSSYSYTETPGQGELVATTSNPRDVTIYPLWTVDLDNPANHILLAGYLARIYDIRLKQFEDWISGANFNFLDPTQQEEQIQAPRNGNNNNADEDANKDNQNEGSGTSGDSSNSSKGDSPEEPSDASNSKVVHLLASLLQPFDFTPTSPTHSQFVFRGFVTSTGAPAIFKSFGEDEDYYSEVKVYQHLQRAKVENVPKVFNFYDEEDSIHMIIEDLGSERLEFDTKEEIKMFAFDLIKAVDALHKAHVIHADLKCSNLHYDKKRRLVKFFDFSYSSVVPDRNAIVSCRGFTHGYTSPEAKKSRTASQIDDMFSVGMILASCVFSFKVRHDDDYKFVKQKITNGNDTKLADKTIIELISQLICDSNVRWTAEQCLQSEYFIDVHSSHSSADEEMKID